jgi:8-oxo-dGTP pyrophosphatase MutT (NUDIX family)
LQNQYKEKSSKMKVVMGDEILVEELKPKICYTASAALIVEGKVLLIKHKKLQTWLTPGGHIDPDETAQAAAEREFWEETALRVKTISAMDDLQISDSGLGEENFKAVPYAVNYHWVSEKNYKNRLEAFREHKESTIDKAWKKDCEKHYNFAYLAIPDGDLDFQRNVEEVDGIAWFSLEEVKKLYERAFELVEKLKI